MVSEKKITVFVAFSACVKPDDKQPALKSYRSAMEGLFAGYINSRLDTYIDMLKEVSD